MRKAILCVLLIIFFMRVKAQTNNDFISLQNFVPPSPEATALGRYGQIPVNYSSGIPSINVPVFEIKSRKLSVPISLSYHASGIKLDDIATTAGLGWVLNTGGSISRNIVGKADENGMRNSYFYSYKDRSVLDVPYSDSNFYYLSYLANGDWDSQSDIYDYNTPAFSGRFVYDIVTKQINYTPVDKQLNIIWNAFDTTYTIINDDGVKYVFGEKEKTEGQYSTNITAWYTTMMISADLTDTIYFKYKNAANFVDSYESQQYSIKVEPDYSQTDIGYCPPNKASEQFSVQSSTLIYYRKLIDSIKFSNGFVNFIYSNDRQDPGTERLSAITIGSKNSVIKKVELLHSYFQSEIPVEVQNTLPPKQAKRLKLDGVYFEDNTSTIYDKYSFQYNTQIILPPYYKGNNPFSSGVGKSTAYDLWGYYNGSTSNYTIPAHFKTQLTNFIGSLSYMPGIDAMANSYDYKSCDRYPNPIYTQACILTKINYPTGGFTQFEFENNKILDDADNNHQYSGGLRVKRTISYDGINNSKPLVKTYAYGNETDVGISIARVVPDDFFYTQALISSNPHYVSQSVFCNGATFTISSNPTTAINYYGGSPIFYSKVTEYNGYPGENEGKTEFIFDYEQDSVYSSSDTYKYWNFSTDKSWARGALLSTKFYKKENGSYFLTKKIENTYTSLGIKSVKPGYLCEQKIVYNNISLYNYLYYFRTFNADGGLINQFDYIDIVLPYGVKKLVKTEETSYSETDSLVVKNETFYESAQHLYPTKMVNYSSKATLLYDIIKYPQDKNNIQNLSLSASAALDGMVSKNMLLFPIETERYKNQTLLLRNRTDYLNWNSSSKYYEQAKSQQILQNPIEQRLLFKSYDDRGNVTQLSKVNDASISYIWDYNKNYMIAQATNADENEIAYESFEAEGGSWDVGSNLRISNSYFTGLQAYDLSNGNITKSGLTGGKTYTVTYWSQSNSSMLVNGNAGIAKVVKKGWTLFEHTVASTNITISGNGIIDELRLFPKNANMLSYTYSSLIGITSTNAVNQTPNFYEYDNYGHLLQVKDADNNTIKKIDFQFRYINNPLANWQSTGNFHSFSGLNGYNTGIGEKEEIDLNTSSPTYNQKQWVLLPIVANPASWVAVTGQTRCKTGTNAGEQQQKYIDQNPYSSSFGQIQWVTSGIACTCITSCSGPSKKLINGCCETGTKVFTNHYYDNSLNRCNATYHFEWSDSSRSQEDYTEYYTGECPAEN